MKNTKKVYIVHHTNQGTPESGEIHAVYSSSEAAYAELDKMLIEYYDVEPDDKDADDFMYISVHEVK